MVERSKIDGMSRDGRCAPYLTVPKRLLAHTQAQPYTTSRRRRQLAGHPFSACPVDDNFQSVVAEPERRLFPPRFCLRRQGTRKEAPPPATAVAANDENNNGGKEEGKGHRQKRPNQRDTVRLETQLNPHRCRIETTLHQAKSLPSANGNTPNPVRASSPAPPSTAYPLTICGLFLVRLTVFKGCHPPANERRLSTRFRQEKGTDSHRSQTSGIGLNIHESISGPNPRLAHPPQSRILRDACFLSFPQSSSSNASLAQEDRRLRTVSCAQSVWPLPSSSATENLGQKVKIPERNFLEASSTHICLAKHGVPIMAINRDISEAARGSSSSSQRLEEQPFVPCFTS